jgi:hypothetical protein
MVEMEQVKDDRREVQELAPLERLGDFRILLRKHRLKS